MRFANEVERDRFAEVARELAPKIEALLPALRPGVGADERPRSLALLSLEIGFKTALRLGVTQPVIFYAIGLMVGRLLGQGDDETREKALAVLSGGMTAGAEQAEAALAPQGRA